MGGFDLAQFGALEGDTFDVAIDNPKTGEPTGITIKVAGSWGELARMAQRVLAHGMTQAKKRGIDMTVLDDPDADPCSAKVIEAEKALSLALTRMMIPRIVGWDGIVWDGQPYPFSRDNCGKLFNHPGFYWLADQLYRKADQAANFTKASSPPSAKPSKRKSASTRRGKTA